MVPSAFHSRTVPVDPLSLTYCTHTPQHKDTSCKANKILHLRGDELNAALVLHSYVSPLNMDDARGGPSRNSGSDCYNLRDDGVGNVVKFTCFLCGLTENCCYGVVEISGRTHTYRYKDEMYYMLDPFRNRSAVNGRRLTQTGVNTGSKTFERSKAPSIFDILILGAICSICGQPVCIGENCSVFYAKTFCIICVDREKTYFPGKFIEQINTSRKQHKAGRKEVKTSV